MGATEAEIATVTGHSLRAVREILDKHYFHRDPALAENLFRKIGQGTESANQAANRLDWRPQERAKT
jgi:hypothetical protein